MMCRCRWCRWSGEDFAALKRHVNSAHPAAARAVRARLLVTTQARLDTLPGEQRRGTRVMLRRADAAPMAAPDDETADVVRDVVAVRSAAR